MVSPIAEGRSGWPMRSAFTLCDRMGGYIPSSRMRTETQKYAADLWQNAALCQGPWLLFRSKDLPLAHFMLMFSVHRFSKVQMRVDFMEDNEHGCQAPHQNCVLGRSGRHWSTCHFKWMVMLLARDRTRKTIQWPKSCQWIRVASSTCETVVRLHILLGWIYLLHYHKEILVVLRCHWKTRHIHIRH